MTRRVLITGAGGFIGGALLSELRSDCEVWAVSGSGESRFPDGVHALRIDLSRPQASAELREALPAQPFDAVLHLAALTPRLGAVELERFFAVNTYAVRYLMNGLPAAPRRFAFFSTVDVYGRQHGGDVFHDDSPVAPTGYYAVSKYAGERVALAWQEESGCPVDVFRLGQVYGPGDPTRKAVPAFVAAAAAGEAPIIQGTGDELRQPIHLRDVAGAVRCWLEHPPPATGRTLLLAGEERITIRGLASLVMAKAGLAGEPRLVPRAAGAEPVHCRCDVSRAETELGWRPVLSLETGIGQLLAGRRAGTGGP